ncbi:hypothetical protein MKQ68_16265 [Chitinophaga horti]|uniref:Copper chaperone CopZ n=1 Tax=Chitinophaga horti TaxID=2920382 RepID=A0ABY6J074_9BACT|nr:hypothetical protein [Chitinophaga horti]UYQ91644.1 hypothetical protein MKQ68_16265 [Chitinophaga horti]
MKKLLTIFIAVLYVAITSGFTVNVHYCMGKVASVKLHAEDDDACGKCGRPGTKGADCCKDVHKFLKVDQSHQAAKVFFSHNVLPLDLDLPVAVLQTPAITVATAAKFSYQQHAPPPVGSQPLFLRNCVFLI